MRKETEMLHHIIGLGIGVTVGTLLGVAALYWRMTHSDNTIMGF
jgi:hypothetical protein